MRQGGLSTLNLSIHKYKKRELLLNKKRGYVQSITCATRLPHRIICTLWPLLTVSYVEVNVHTTF